jgi:hypothetical protein
MFRKPQSADDYLKWMIGGVVIVVFAVIGMFVMKESENALQPKPVKEKDQAKTIKDLGRDHITNIAGQTYNSNPPTSGKHFPMWAKRGAYAYQISDGYLLHSLEHGYIVISYNCGEKAKPISTISYKDGEPFSEMHANGQGKMSPFTPEEAPKKEGGLPNDFSSKSCKDLVAKLSKFLKEYQRVVIVPRPNLDTTIALTAWTKLDKMNTFEEERISAFIAAYHNKGPEQTME